MIHAANPQTLVVIADTNNHTGLNLRSLVALGGNVVINTATCSGLTSGTLNGRTITSGTTLFAPYITQLQLTSGVVVGYPHYP